MKRRSQLRPLLRGSNARSAGSLYHVGLVAVWATLSAAAAHAEMFAMLRSPGANTVSRLVKVSQDPFDFSLVGEFGAARLSGLAFDPTTGLLYACSARGPNSYSLFTVEPENGAATRVGPFNNGDDAVHDLAIDSTGTIFGVSADRIYTIDPATGAATLLGRFRSSDPVRAIGVDPTTDTLYGIGDENGDVYMFDKSDATATRLGSIGGLRWRIDGLGFDNDGTAFVTLGNEFREVFSVDIATMTATSAGALRPGVGSLSDIAFERLAPEPAEPPVARSLHVTQDGVFELEISGQPGAEVEVLGSEDGTRWTVLGQLALDGPAPASFADPESPLFPARLYRLRYRQGGG